jgi:uncharacterized surface protein with fasciclin (FAS1) repeats
MKKLLFLSVTFLAVLFTTNTVVAQCQSSKAKAMTVAESTKPDVVDIAISSKDHTTLVAAVKAADLVNTLKSDGPFTVFAPTNAAFDKLPEGTIATLLKPENKGQLQSILTYHVIAGNFDANAVVKAIKDNNGMAKLTTVQGGTIIASINDGKVMLKDENGNMATVTATDLKGSNGVIHVIDSVVLPK